MRRAGAALVLTLAVAGGAVAYGLLRENAAPEVTVVPGDDACNRCDARQRDKVRLRETLAAREKAEN